MKKKLTFSLILTFTLCFCILTVTVCAGISLLSVTPDSTQPLASGMLPAAHEDGSWRADHVYVHMENENSTQYHLAIYCRDKVLPYQLTLSEALALGIEGCTECIGDHGRYYTSENDPDYHCFSDCEGITGEVLSVSLMEALALNKAYCRLCGERAGRSDSGIDLKTDPVYASLEDDYYHFDEFCPKAPSEAIPLNTAIQNGKIPCPECMTVYQPAVDNPMQTEVWHISFGEACMAAPDEARLVPLDKVYGMLPACRWCVLYVSPDSRYIHRDPLCSELSSASPCSYGYAEKTGKESCPICCPDEWPSPSLLGGSGDVSYDVSYELLDTNASVRYTSSDDLRYHKDTSCLHLLGTAYEGASEAVMIESGKTACPWCLREVWYVSEFSSCYHAKTDCSGIMDLAPCPVDDPRIEGLSPCAVCALETVYCTAGSPLYHLTSACTAFGYSNLKETSIVKALSEDRIPCPFCLSSNCMYWPDGKESSEYHLYLCSEMESIKDHSGAIQGTFFEAESCGLTICPHCAEITGVFWSPTDPNRFHKDSTCVETDVSAPARIIEMRLAAQNGMQPCEQCTVDFFYAPVWSAFYHSNYSCSGMSPSNLRILTLEEAAASGQTACLVCTHSALHTVLFSDEDDYYHTVAACADIVGQTRLLSESAAIAAGRSACAECLYCYVSASDRSVFHMDPKCSPVSDLEGVFVIDTIAIGSIPCPDCVYWTSPEDTLYHNNSDCTNCGEASSAPCTLDYALMTGRTYCADWHEMQTASQGDVLSGEREVYFVETESGLYHLNPKCPGEKRVPSMLLSDALAEGRVACENCLTIYTHSNPGRSSALYESILSAPLKPPSDQTATLTLSTEGFQDNLYSAIPVTQDKWVSGSLTVHSLLVLRTHAGIYLEAEYTLTDPSIDPESIRMTYYCEGYGSFGWNSASVSPVSYDDGSVGYILQTVIPKLTLPDSAADAQSGGTMSLRSYGKTLDGQTDLSFVFE